MKFTDPEQTFINMLIAAGGSYCPPSGMKLARGFLRLARRLESRGVITIEQVDTGYRYSLVSK